MRIPIYFEKLSMYERREEPCTVALPFAQGKLKQGADISVLDGELTLPTQARVTSTWPDGSVKWLLLHFLADLPAGQDKQLVCSTETPSISSENQVQVDNNDKGCSIRTGALSIELSGPGEQGVFRSIQLVGGQPLNQVSGPVIRDDKGRAFSCEVGPEGWKVLESGPIRIVVQAEGKHVGQGAANGQWFDYVVRLYAYAGKPWVRMDYQIIHRENPWEQSIQALELSIENPARGQVRTALGKSNYATNIRQSAEGERISHQITAEELKYQGNEHTPEIFYGTFWGDWNDAQTGGFSVTLHQAQQNFPKLLDVSEQGIKVGVIPEGTHLTMLQGMAKTHRLYLHLHGPDESLEEINVRSLQFQLPDRPVLDPQTYEDAGVMEPLTVARKVGSAERTLTHLADYRARAYGILHWGDAPDQAYTEQGRGKGDWVWTNNEYDLPHSMMHMYARKKERRFLDYLLVAAEHWMDVDICHHSDNPLRYQGQIPHSANHVTDNPAVCHEWVEGLLDYYHMTGEWRALEAAVGVGHNVLRILKTPKFREASGLQARESGWALRSLGALYTETGDERWLVPAERIVEQFEVWKDKYGNWLSPYTDHTVIRVPFMISVAVNSLMRYYRIRPEERVERMIVDAMEDLLEHTYLKDEEMFVYKDLQSLIRIGTTNPIVLEALSYAYEFTGDPKFIQAGKVSFQTLVRRIEREIGSFSKEISGDALLLWQGLGPKFFAQYYYPLFYYYRTAAAAGFEL